MKPIIAAAAAMFLWAGAAPVMAATAAGATTAVPAAVTAVRAAVTAVPVAVTGVPAAVTGVPAAELAASAAVMSGTAAGSAAAPLRPVVYDCDGWHHGQVRFRRIYLTCDGSVIVTVTGWKYWTAISARSRGGKLLVDTCRPDCAAGHYRKYASTVVFYRARWHHGVRYFTRMRLRYWHGRLRNYVYRWGRYPGGSRPVWVGGP